MCNFKVCKCTLYKVCVHQVHNCIFIKDIHRLLVSPTSCCHISVHLWIIQIYAEVILYCIVIHSWDNGTCLLISGTANHNHCISVFIQKPFELSVCYRIYIDLLVCWEDLASIAVKYIAQVICFWICRKFNIVIFDKIEHLFYTCIIHICNIITDLVTILIKNRISVIIESLCVDSLWITLNHLLKCIHDRAGSASVSGVAVIYFVIFVVHKYDRLLKSSNCNLFAICICIRKICCMCRWILYPVI